MNYNLRIPMLPGSFHKLGLIWSNMSVDDVPGCFCILILIFAFLLNSFSWTPFNIESPNTQTHIFFLFVFGFISLNSLLFGELVALFLSAWFLIFLVLSKLSFSSDLLSAMSDLVLMSFWSQLDIIPYLFISLPRYNTFFLNSLLKN